jgi:hypothetical protein
MVSNSTRIVLKMSISDQQIEDTWEMECAKHRKNCIAYNTKECELMLGCKGVTPEDVKRLKVDLDRSQEVFDAAGKVYETARALNLSRLDATQKVCESLTGKPMEDTMEMECAKHWEHRLAYNTSVCLLQIGCKGVTPEDVKRLKVDLDRSQEVFDAANKVYEAAKALKLARM